MTLVIKGLCYNRVMAAILRGSLAMICEEEIGIECQVSEADSGSSIGPADRFPLTPPQWC